MHSDKNFHSTYAVESENEFEIVLFLNEKKMTKQKTEHTQRIKRADTRVCQWGVICLLLANRKTILIYQKMELF